MKLHADLASTLERQLQLVRGEEPSAARLVKDGEALVARAKQRVDDAVRERDEVVRRAEERVAKARQELKEVEKRFKGVEKIARKGKEKE